MLGDSLGLSARIALQSPQHGEIQQHTNWSSGMAITARYILHFFFAASFFTFGNIIWTQRGNSDKAECGFTHISQAAFVAAFTAYLCSLDSEPKSLMLAIFANLTLLLSSIAAATKRPTDRDPVFIILISQFPFIIPHLTFCNYEVCKIFRWRLLTQYL